MRALFFYGLILSLFTTFTILHASENETVALEAATQQVEEPKSESEIPLFTKKEDPPVESSSLWPRLLISFLILGFGVLALTRASRWWHKKTTGHYDQTKIKVITQHYLGPKKSLAIVRVAGESILIGVTDHSISHIKTLSLIEGEEAALLETTNRSESTPSFDSVIDRVSTKIKEMRPL